MTTADREDELSAEELRKAVIFSLSKAGDLSCLSDDERAAHYNSLAKDLGINPLTKPFDYLRLNGKLVLYVNKGGTDQLAARHNITRTLIDGPVEIVVGGTKMVKAVCEATLPNGRREVSVATVPMTDPLNVYMRAETKAKRRGTLSILGLGMLDETEVRDIAASEKAEVPEVLEATTARLSAAASAPASSAPAAVAAVPAPQAESKRSIAIDPSFLESLMAKARDVEITALTIPNASVVERVENMGYGLARLWLEETAKCAPEMREEISNYLARFADGRRCLSSYQRELSMEQASRALPSLAAQPEAPAPPAPPAPSAPAAPEAPADSKAIIDLRDALRAIKPASLSSFAGVWVCLGSILSKEDRSRGQAVLREEIAAALPTATNADLIDAIKKNKENPVEEAYSRDFLAPTDDSLWIRYLETLDRDGNVAGSFGKRAQLFRSLSGVVAKQRFEAAVARMAELTGKSNEECATRLRDIVKHNENAKGAAAADEASAASA